VSSSKLKIFIIGPAFPFRGGPARYNENLCAELIRAGHDAAIISYSLQYPSFLFPGSSQYEEGGSAPAGIPIHTLINTVNPLNWVRVARFIRKQKPDFILFRYWLPFFGPSLGTIGRLSRKRTIVLALTDNVLPHEKRAGDKQFTNYFIRSCDGFIAMSKKVLEDISLFNAKAPRAFSPHPMYETYGAPVPMAEARRAIGVNEGDQIVLFFGLIRQYKGLDLLLEAMGSEEMKRRNVKLLIAGEFYESKESYLKQISDLGLSQQVIMHDHFIRDDMVRYYFCAANLVAQTYRNATNSGVTMVGYYYGRPMLVSNVGGLKEILPDGKCGYVVEPDASSIAEKLDDFFSNNREPEFEAHVALERAKYQWPAFIGRLIDLYEECKRNRKGSHAD
jgi:D-inositol-3-phosphate glycosyltransferase